MISQSTAFQHLSRASVITALFAMTAVARATTNIDIAIIYTPAASSYNGGTSGMSALAAASVASLNTAFTNSGIDARARLVYTGQVSYTETTSFATDLQRLQGTSDGYVDTVHSLRTTYGADFVCLIRRGPAGNVAGLAYVMTTVNTSFGPYGFSVVADQYATSNYSFAHEIGHNLGCTHDRANASSGGAYSYSYGYNFTGNNAVNYGTVMCYPGVRIPYFSNPSVSYQGVATGVASGGTAANNALTIENTRNTAGSLRAAIDTIIVGDLVGDTKADIIFGGPDGKLIVWEMNGATRVSSTILSSTYSGTWSPLSVYGSQTPPGPSNDGKGLWFKNTDGRIALWVMDSTGLNRVSGSIVSQTFSNGWTPVGPQGQYSAPERIVFKHSDGRLAYWAMSEATRDSAATLAATYTPGVWTPIATAYFADDQPNHSGGPGYLEPDILFKSTDGRLAIWFMDDVYASMRKVPGVVLSDTFSNGWSPVGAADFDGDGKADILFKCTDGRLALWFMDGATRLSATILANTLADG